MTRTFGHENTLRYLYSERSEEYKAAALSLALAIVFTGIAIASGISIKRETHFIFPAVMGAAIAAGCFLRAVDCVSAARGISRQIENLEEDTRL
jgi:hypothetical protein